MARWSLVASAPVLTNRWLSVFQNQYEIEGRGSVDDYYVIHRDDFVLILAIHGEQLVMVKQYRPATDQTYLCLPAGYIEPGETAEMAAHRELGEETGFCAEKCTLVGELHPLPGFLRSRAFVVVCEGIHGKGGQTADEEVKEVVEIDMATVLKKIVSGEINEMQAVSAILLVYVTRQLQD